MNDCGCNVWVTLGISILILANLIIPVGVSDDRELMRRYNGNPYSLIWGMEQFTLVTKILLSIILTPSIIVIKSFGLVVAIGKFIFVSDEDKFKVLDKREKK